MRRLILASLILCAALLPGGAFAYVSPGAPSGYVNDFAKVLSPEKVASLNAELTAFHASTSNEVAVALVPSLGGDYIENYAVRLFEEWGIGDAQKDNGVLLLLAIEDRELRIEVGYGLEGVLPDSLAARIIDEMTPSLKEGDYDGAVALGVSRIEAATKGEYTGEGEFDFSGVSFDAVWAVLFAVFFVLQWIAAVLARSKSWWAGGIVGLLIGAGAGVIFAFGTFITVALGLGLGLFGLLLDFIVSNAYTGAKSIGGSVPWWAGGGSTSGHSSGGGFGGFGGGSSGGGGASGSW